MARSSALNDDDELRDGSISLSYWKLQEQMYVGRYFFADWLISEINKATNEIDDMT